MPLKVLLAGVALAAALAAAPACAADLNVTLDNQASAAVKEFYASPVDANGWDENLLAADALPPGSSRQIIIRNGRDICTFDLRIVFADDEQTDEPAVNLCDTGSYTVADPPADD